MRPKEWDACALCHPSRELGKARRERQSMLCSTSSVAAVAGLCQEGVQRPLGMTFLKVIASPIPSATTDGTV